MKEWLDPSEVSNKKIITLIIIFGIILAIVIAIRHDEIMKIFNVN